MSIKIGPDICISQGYYLCTGSHDHRQVDFRHDCRPIVIASEVGLAAGTFVEPEISIGRVAAVSARSLMLRDLDAETIYAGAPARRFGPRFPQMAELPVLA